MERWQHNFPRILSTPRYYGNDIEEGRTGLNTQADPAEFIGGDVYESMWEDPFGRATGGKKKLEIETNPVYTTEKAKEEGIPIRD